MSMPCSVCVRVSLSPTVNDIIFRFILLQVSALHNMPMFCSIDALDVTYMYYNGASNIVLQITLHMKKIRNRIGVFFVKLDILPEN